MLQRRWLQATQSYCGATLPRMLGIGRRSRILLGQRSEGSEAEKQERWEGECF